MTILIRRSLLAPALHKGPRVHAVRHSRGSGNPLLRPTWMPAFAGMTATNLHFLCKAPCSCARSESHLTSHRQGLRNQLGDVRRPHRPSRVLDANRILEHLHTKRARDGSRPGATALHFFEAQV